MKTAAILFILAAALGAALGTYISNIAHTP